MSEREGALVRPAGPPSRCPFCHADVDREREAWVACHACLAPHHEGCWREGGRCAGCGEARSVGGGGDVVAAQAPRIQEALEPGPELDLELRGRRAHFEGAGSIRVPVRPGAEAWLVVRVRNETDRPARLELRDLPAWLRAAEPAVDVDPGKTAELRAMLDHAATQDEVCRGEVVEGTLVVGGAEDARTVRVELVLAPSEVRAVRRRRLTLAGVAAVALVLYLGLMSYVRTTRIRALEEHAVVVQGHVTKLTPSNHNQMYYEYEAEGEVYERNDFARGERVGDPVTVCYLAGAPGVSVRGFDYGSYVIPGPFVALPFVGLMFTVIALVVTAIHPVRRKPPPPAR